MKEFPLPHEARQNISAEFAQAHTHSKLELANGYSGRKPILLLLAFKRTGKITIGSPPQTTGPLSPCHIFLRIIAGWNLSAPMLFEPIPNQAAAFKLRVKSFFMRWIFEKKLGFPLYRSAFSSTSLEDEINSLMKTILILISSIALVAVGCRSDSSGAGGTGSSNNRMGSGGAGMSGSQGSSSGSVGDTSGSSGSTGAGSTGSGSTSGSSGSSGTGAGTSGSQ
ncbi:MAG: hypothetical protein JWQ71_2488 [Pedosphaera sp.]|nr:hypothetical protein [Pedosphaera sp.]